jgi:hypothetical protein
MGGVSRGGRLALEEKLAAVVPLMCRDIAGAMCPPIELLPGFTVEETAGDRNLRLPHTNEKIAVWLEDNLHR